MNVRLTILFLMLTVLAFGQSPDIKRAYRIDGSNIVLFLDRNWSRAEQEKLLEKSGMKGLSLDTLWTYGSVGRWAQEGWKVSKYGKTSVKIYKSLDQLEGDLKWYKEVMMIEDELAKIRTQTAATFGFNKLKKLSVAILPSGDVQFFLEGNTQAKEVILSGTFNNWSTLSQRMEKTDSGWVTRIPLAPGKHCYKYIVDGHWWNDAQNLNKENDFHGGLNSVYYVPNHIFTLRGFSSAKSVTVAGDFNNWNDKEVRLAKTKTGWELPVYLMTGTYEYKFIVDKNWITDPSNFQTIDNGRGIKNSLLQLGQPYSFALKGFKQAREVFVAGNFNGWNPQKLKMKPTESGWVLPYVLAEGNYQYKFIVDGEWILDPSNPYTASEAGHENSLLCIKPTHTFMLKDERTAHDVKVAGTFNHWTGYSMKKTADGWELDVNLPRGKHLYKFIVDGKWIIDPGNPLWEDNEFHNGNSVLWIGVQ